MTKTQNWVPMTVTEVHQETDRLLSIQLTPELEGAQFGFRAGQYVQVDCGGKPAYFAIASEPEETRYIEFLVKDEPEQERGAFCLVKPDDQVRVSMPIGKGFPVELLKGKDIILVAMGTALSAIRSVLKSILRDERQFGKVVLLYGIREPKDLPFPDDFNIWKRKIRVEFAMSRPGKAFWNGFVGHVTTLLEKFDFNPAESMVCVCGSKAMERHAAGILEKRGISKDQILFNL